MKRTISLIVVALLLNCWSAIVVFATGLPRLEASNDEIERLSYFIQHSLEDEAVNGSQIGILATTIQGDTLVAINHKQRFVPASNMKIISAGLALNILGKDYRYPTNIAYSGEIVDGVLNGDIYIIGGGDPTTGANLPFISNVNTLFAQWKTILSKNGIKTIKGLVVADPRIYNTIHSELPSWEFEDSGYYYGVGPQGINFYENAQWFTIRPGLNIDSKPSITIYYPQTPWMDYINLVKTGGKGTKNTISYTNSQLYPIGEFSGSFPIDRKAYTLKASNRFAPYTLAYYFYNYLKDSGIKVNGYADVDFEGHIRENLTGKSSTLAALNPKTIGTTYSPSLYQIIAHTLAESDNFFAESLLRSIGYKVGNIQDYGVKAALTAIKEMGIDEAIQLVDGSGLSRHNYASPSFFVNFLTKMADNQDFIFLMPSPGNKGTLEFKFKDAPDAFKQRIKMKSGTMNGIRCYSGYILSSDNQGDTIVFSILLNNNISSSRECMPIIDSIIQALSEYN